MGKNALLFGEAFETMPWDAVDNVVFDIGNVLLRSDPSDLLEALFPDPQRRETIAQRVFHGPEWVALDRGTLRYGDAPRLMARGDAALEADIALLMEKLRDHKDAVTEPVPIAQGWAAARACAAHGKRLCLLSNYQRDTFEYNLAHYEIFSLFDLRLISCYVHQLKPEPEIYDTLIHVAGLDPARTLFLDDTFANIAGARAAGIHGYWVRSAEEMGRFFGAQCAQP